MKYTYNKLVRDKIPENINSMEGSQKILIVWKEEKQHGE